MRDRGSLPEISRPGGLRGIVTALEKQSTVREDLLGDIIERLRARINELSMGEIYIEGRVKDIYSIYRKMFMQNKTIDEVYDLYAVRIIVDTKDDCYNILGIIHDMYKPIPGRFKDYISTPKPNMYQSLHTTVIGRAGIPFEVQIRTWEMHHVAEYGIAAHEVQAGADERRFKVQNKLNGFARCSRQRTRRVDFLSTSKIDMFADEVSFSPAGRRYKSPRRRDRFRIQIHSERNHMIGAKVNSRMVQIDHALKTATSWIVTSKAAKGPSRDWLKIVKTNEASSKIKQWYKREKRDENISEGRDALNRELRRLTVPQSALDNDEVVQAVIKKLSFNSVEELLAGIGYGGITPFRGANA